MENKIINLGIFGFGCVGQGLYEVLNRTKGINARIKKICIKDPNKPRPIDASYFTTDKNEILQDPTIDVVVELINETEAAFEIVSTALRNGKAVVSASKRMIAENLPALYQLQVENKVPFLYEASSCASIPIVRNLEEYYDNDLLNAVEGICNGSTNYILTKIFEENQGFNEALQKAQELGFAETDPTLDIEGYDPKFKIVILLLHAFGTFVKPEEVFNFGIHRLNDFDIQFAKQRNSTVKLIAGCRRQNGSVNASVLPHLVKEHNLLYDVYNEYNGILLESAFTDKQFFVGKGAGGTATGSAVLSDISALTYNYRYEYKKIKQSNSPAFTNDVQLKIYLRYRTADQVHLPDFYNISEKYESSTWRYIVGVINLEKLKEAKWLKNPDVNLLVLE
ncbi:homoserine dehydrogenase [Chitinophaga sancti]|uniref:Homoserine dehydrogenase n=1 Tax=Chitinophaga sancti TaxID=1004 RepID=A0A1K1PTU9_9BACT|nr:homoserine dehydrogenase [Chitinophaga sancti]WQD61657.1 homoserine dehydrogenase [Chitinophaga sancti]WQG92786.1 homoserine dehydrogenase [Chitinophaga sancti]SFW50892.1 homoserine dehydrogenase [Chitinophaga sancti]